MRLIVTSEERFARSADGSIWTRGACASRFWLRYLEVFQEVIVVARIINRDVISEEWRRSDRPGVTFWALPHYLGPTGFARHYRQLRRGLSQAFESHDAILFRSPSPIAALAQREIKSGRPYAVEIVGDPFDAFAPKALNHPARPLVRWYLTHHLVRQCGSATAVAYVTKGSLQQRYRAAPDAFTTSYSSIDLDETAFIDQPRSLPSHNCYRLISVGSMDAQYKGFDVLIDALRLMRQRGVPVELTLVGDGRFRPVYQQHASRLNLEQFVTFSGHLPAGDAIRHQLDNTDCFVLASKSEGLPRAMIEAMARGLPCVGTSVGGVPELLHPDCVVPPNDPGQLCEKILSLLQNQERYIENSARNLARAREYHLAVLAARRNSLYSYLHSETARWCMRTSGAAA